MACADLETYEVQKFLRKLGFDKMVFGADGAAVPLALQALTDAPRHKNVSVGAILVFEGSVLVIEGVWTSSIDKHPDVDGSRKTTPRL